MELDPLGYGGHGEATVWSSSRSQGVEVATQTERQTFAGVGTSIGVGGNYLAIIC